MKMKFKVGLIIAILLAVLTSCGNKNILDTKFTFNRAIITLPDGTLIDDKVASWRDYDGEQLQITLADGKTYLTSSYNCVLIKE